MAGVAPAKGVEVADLPSLAPPDDDALCHLWNEQAGLIALCGAKGGKHLTHDWAVYLEECSCGAKLCPTCRDIRQTTLNTGIVP